MEGAAERAEVVRATLLVRVGMLLLQSLSSALVPNVGDMWELARDGRINAFVAPANASQCQGNLDRIIVTLMGGTSTWDGQHFMFIARHGYLLERHFAFFPLLPALLSLPTDTVMTSSLDLTSPVLCPEAQLLVSGAVLNLVCQVATSCLLYSLALHVTSDARVGRLSVLLFIFNPASVFFTACYSESLFLALTTAALLALHKELAIGSALLFSLASSTRANGIVNAGFFGYIFLLQMCGKHKRTTLLDKLWRMTEAAVCALVTAAPYLLFQYYAYVRECGGAQISIPPDIRAFVDDVNSHPSYHSWCESPLPCVYSFVQGTYWDNGLLSYYTLNNAPHFLLAAPMLLAVWHTVSGLYSVYRQPLRLFGMQALSDKEKLIPPAAVQLVFYALFAVFFMNIQVVTRLLLASCPMLYIMWGTLLNMEMTSSNIRPTQDPTNHRPLLSDLWVIREHWARFSWHTRCFFSWVGAYLLLGFLLHPNRLPWT